MDKAILLQKQVRENSEDFQNALRDMVAWQEEMKRKDSEIRNAKDDQDLPPVRSKKKKKVVPAPEKSSVEKEKPIASSDYKSWDKFDADKACREVEEKNISKDKEETKFEIPSEEQLSKEQAEATKYKDEGNALVQKKEYAKAVGKYSQAIKIFPYDAIFFANRALCQLKLDNLYAADADCTHAIKLDERYVKAYHRRATARMELKRYKDAKKDFEKMLELEPNNKEAALKLKQIEEKMNKSSKPIIIDGENEKSSIESTIGKKVFGTKAVDSQSNNGKSDEKKKKIVEFEEPKPSTSKEKLVIEGVNNKISALKEKNQGSKNITNIKKSGSVTEAKNFNKDFDDKKSNEDEKDKIVKSELPPWVPKLKEGLSIVQPITEAPRQFNKNLKRIEITEIAEHESIFGDIVEEDVIGKKSIKENSTTANSQNKSENVSDNNSKRDIEETANLPPPPKTSVGFFMSWRKCVSNEFRYKYLKQIVPKDLPTIIKASMEYNVLSDIISILNSKFVSNKDKIYDWLFYLSKLERFRALILFMEPADKEAVKGLLEYCKTEEGKSDDEVNKLYAVYEL